MDADEKGKPSDQAWHVVKGTPRVTGFVGSGQNPTPLSEEEVQQIVYKVASVFFFGIYLGLIDAVLAQGFKKVLDYFTGAGG